MQKHQANTNKFEKLSVIPIHRVF